MKQYFIVKLRKHTKNCTHIFEGLIKFLGTQIFFYGRTATGSAKLFRPHQYETANFFSEDSSLSTIYTIKNKALQFSAGVTELFLGCFLVSLLLIWS